MPTADIDLFAQDGDHRYLLISGIYYRWSLGKGWAKVDSVPDTLNWSVLQPAQRAAYEKELPK